MSGRILRHWSVCAAIAMLAASAVSGAAQRGLQKSIFVGVLDENGKPLTDLAINEFAIREDTADRQIVAVKPPSQPISVAVLIDTAQGKRVTDAYGTAEEYTRDLRVAASAFAKRLLTQSPNAEVSLMEFGQAAIVMVPFTPNPMEFEKGVNRLVVRPDVGSVLFEALAQAKAAFLQADASAKQAEMNAQRASDLFQRKVSSEQERDNATQSAAAARAQAEAQRAAVEQAQLSLDYTTIHAPVDGIAGLVKVQVGDLISAGTTLTTVTKVDPVKAYFTVSEQRFSEYSRRYADPQLRIAHEKELRFELILADGTTYPHTGEWFAADNQVDIRTGSIRIAASFPNPGNILRPGQFARIRVLSEVKPNALLVPQRAVIELQGTTQVVVIGTDNKAHIQPVKMGRRIDHEWIVEDGLKAGDRIVVEGVQKAREGAPVNPKQWIPPSPTPAPAPASSPR